MLGFQLNTLQRFRNLAKVKILPMYKISIQAEPGLSDSIANVCIEFFSGLDECYNPRIVKRENDPGCVFTTDTPLRKRDTEELAGICHVYGIPVTIEKYPATP